MNTGIESLMIHQTLFGVHYIPRTTLGVRDIVMRKLDMVPTLSQFHDYTNIIKIATVVSAKKERYMM